MPSWLNVLKDICIGVVGNFIAQFICWLIKHLELQKKIWSLRTRLIKSLYSASIKVLIAIFKVIIAASDVYYSTIKAVKDEISNKKAFAEAYIGLLIEISFIATLTLRLFAQ